jgi:hypothetical protein
VRNVRLLALPLASLLACSDPIEPLPAQIETFDPPGTAGGTRLQAQYVESAAGGPRRFLQMIDRESGDPCWLTRWANEETTVLCRPKASGMVVYLDPACTTPYLETNAEVGQWASAFGVVRVGPRLDPQPTERYLEFSPGQCASMPEAPWDPVHEISEEIVDLPTGRIIDDASDTHILVRNFQGDDGSHVLYQLADRLAQVQCLPKETPAGSRCAPDTSFEMHDEGFLDIDCERLAVLEYGDNRVGIVPERANEVYRFEIPARAQDPFMGRRELSGECTVEQQNTGRKTLHIGTPYPDRDWPVLEARVSADEALSARIATTPQGERAEPEPDRGHLGFFEANGEPCSPVWIEGLLRCAPAIPEVYRSYEFFYADRACSERLVVMGQGELPAFVTVHETSTPRSAYALPTGAVYQLGEEAQDTRYRRNVYGDCELDNINRRQRYYRLGAKQEKERYPELRLVYK